MVKRRATNRTRVPRRALAKAKRVMGKKTKAKAKRNMDTFFFKAKSAATISPRQGVSVANYIYQNIGLMDATQPWSCTQNAEFKLYCSLYDKVRINSVKVRIIPKANVLDQVNAQNENALNVSGSGNYYTAIDRDGPVPSNVAAILRYPSVRKQSILKGMTRTYALKWPTGLWLDTQNLYIDNDNLQRQGAFGCVGIYAENVLEESLELFNEPWATIEMEWNCVFQGKTSASLSLADDGKTICVLSHDNIANLEVSDMLPQYGGFVNKTTDNNGTIVSLTDRGDHTTA